MRRFFASLRVRLLLLVFLAFGPMLGLVLYTYSAQMRQATLAAEEEALRLARLATNDQQRVMEGARQLLIALAQLPSIQNPDAPACSDFLTDLLQQYPLYANFMALTTDGDVFCSAIPAAMPANWADSPWFLHTLQDRDFVVGDFVFSRITGRPSLRVAYPVLDEHGQVRAVVAAGLNMDWLDQFVAEAQLPEGSTLSVFDSTGKVLPPYPDPDQWQRTTLPTSLMESLRSQEAIVRDADGLDGVPRLYGIVRPCCSPTADIYVSVGIPKAVAFAEANRTLTRNLIILAGISLLVLGAAWAEARFSLLRPFETLLGVIKRFEAGDASARTGETGGSGEFGHLARAFDQMASTLEARERERDHSEEALKLHSTRTETLAALAGRLNTFHDVDGVSGIVCQEATRALVTSGASIRLYDEDRDVLETVCYCGSAEDLGEQIKALESCMWAQGLKAGEPLVIPDLLASSELPNAPKYSAANIRSLACIPMVHEKRLVGTLCIFALGQETHEYTEEEMTFLRAIADQAAQAIVNAQLFEALLSEQSARAALLEETISAQEDERKRIARELHDQTSQDLAALLLSLDTCALSLPGKGPQAEQHLHVAKTITEAMLANIRRLINDLRPSLLDDLGLAPAIMWYAEQRLKPLGIAVVFQCDRMDTRLPAPVETAMFRITQEALTNVVKHSQATKVQVTLAVDNHNAHLAVRDNGVGFQLQTKNLGEKDGYELGLRGMQERAAMLGGKLQIQTTPGQGTSLVADIPLLEEVSTDAQNSRVADG